MRMRSRSTTGLGGGASVAGPLKLQAEGHDARFWTPGFARFDLVKADANF